MKTQTKWEEMFEELMDMRRNAFVELKEMKDRGEMIAGTFCQYAPAEIINAAGFFNVGLCGKSYEPIPLAETELPANLCPLVKSSYGHVLGETCPFAFFSDIVIGETTCDGKKKMFEMLARHKPMHVIHLPNVPDKERSLEGWVMELKHLKTTLEEKFGIEITDEALREQIQISNNFRKLRAAIYELGKMKPPPITGKLMKAAISSTTFITDKTARTAKLQEIIDYCLEQYYLDNGPFPRNSRPSRILVSGASLDGVSAKTIDVIEELGGAIVCYEGCSGIVSMRRLIDENEDMDPIVSIAEKYLEVPCAVMSPNQRRMEQVAQTIDEWDIDGVVSITLHACTPFTVESYNIKQVCDEKGVPFLHLQSDFSPGDEGQLRTRIEAFLEMLS